MKIKVNYDHEDLFCIASKEQIEIGEKYVEVQEEYLGEIIIKTYKLDYAPIEDDDDNEDPWLTSDNTL